MTLRLWGALLSQELRRTFSYRVNFWMQFFTATIAEIAVAYFLWLAIFESQGAEIIGGYTFAAMVNYYIFVALAGRVIRGREMFQVSTEIYEGGLTRYLLYPVEYFKFKFTEHIGFLFLSTLQVFLGLVVLSLVFSADASPYLNVEPLFLGLISAMTASFLYFLIGFAIELVAFWADNVWSLAVMSRFIIGFLGGLILPLSLYPDWAQQILHYTPFPAMGSIPVRLFMGEAGWSEFWQGQMTLALWALPLGLLTWVVWRRGVLRYTGVGQ